MSTLLFFLHVAIANDPIDSIETLYKRQRSIEAIGMMQQDLAHSLPAGDPAHGFVVSHKNTIDRNFESLRLVVVDINKKSKSTQCDIGLVGYYFVSTNDYQKLVEEESILKIKNHYHVFLDESDRNGKKIMRKAYKAIITDGCS